MGKAATPCETVTVTVRDEDGNEVSTVIPAYTRSRGDLSIRLHEIVTEYLNRSEAEGESMSVGDFALFVMAKAAQDPRSMS